MRSCLNKAARAAIAPCSSELAFSARVINTGLACALGASHTRAPSARPAGGARQLLLAEDAQLQGALCFGDKAAGCCGARHCEHVVGAEGSAHAVTRTLLTADGAPHTQFTLSLAPLATLRGMPVQQVPLS